MLLIYIYKNKTNNMEGVFEDLIDIVKEKGVANIILDYMYDMETTEKYDEVLEELRHLYHHSSNDDDDNTYSLTIRRNEYGYIYKRVCYTKVEIIDPEGPVYDIDLDVDVAETDFEEGDKEGYYLNYDCMFDKIDIFVRYSKLNEDYDEDSDDE